MGKKPKKPEPKAVAGIVVVSVEVSRQMAEDIMETASYGCAYWARALEHPDCGPDTPNYAIEEDESSTAGPAKQAVICPDLIVNGIRLIMAPTFSVRADIRATIFSALAEDDASNIDNEAADTIVQAGVFGELVYG